MKGGGGRGTICYAVEGIRQGYRLLQKSGLVFDRLNFNYVFTDVDNREIKG